MPYVAKSCLPWYSNRSTPTTFPAWGPLHGDRRRIVVDPGARHQTEDRDDARLTPDWCSTPVGTYTVPVAFSASDRRVLVVATVAVVVAGVLLAGVLLFATGRNTSPGAYQPFSAGNADAIR